MAEWIFGAAKATLTYMSFPPSTPAIPRPHQNLRRYAQAAVLPQMKMAQEAPQLPSSGQPSHQISLAITYENYRVLESIHIQPMILNQALAFNQIHSPDTPRGESDGDTDLGSDITIPAPEGGYQITEKIIGNVADLSRVFKWVHDYPLQTVHRMMQLVYPETVDYDFREEIHRDHQLMRSVIWGPAEATMMDAGDLRKPSIAVFVQAPWILSTRDLQMFVQSRMLPNAPTKPGQIMRGVHRVWAKIYDVCSHKRPRYFVLTNYNEWVFGTFSAEMTQAWVSPVVSWNSREPTVMEQLFFWFASAATSTQPRPLPGAWVIPQVPEPIQWEYEDSDMEQDQLTGQGQDVEMENGAIPASESDWTAQSDARYNASTRTVSDDDDDIETITDGDLAGTSQSRPRRYYDQADITRWVSHPRQSSPTPSLASFLSSTTSSEVSTVKDLGEEDTQRGTYMRGSARSGEPNSIAITPILQGFMTGISAPVRC